MNYVFDACALIALLRGEKGAETVEELLRAPEHTCFVHAINLMEVQYDFIRNADQETARRALEDLTASGIIINQDLKAGLVEQAAQIKARGRISLADSLCLAFAIEQSATLVTSDHHEFDALAKAYSILFIR